MPHRRPTLPDRIRGWFDPEYAARAAQLRAVSTHAGEQMVRFFTNLLGAEERRVDRGGWSTQPWAPDGTRTLTPANRKSMVKRARQIDEENLLGSSLLDRAVDNIIGTSMTVQARSRSKRFNANAEAAWKDWQNDASAIDLRGLMDGAQLQRCWYRSRRRDGDVLIVPLRDGRIQTIEADFLQSPYGVTDTYTRSGASPIIDGVELDGDGRPVRFHVAKSFNDRERRRQSTTTIDARDAVYYADIDRQHPRIVRGRPLLAMLGPLLDQIDGTIEAVVMAHRMAAIFGLLLKRADPGRSFAGLPYTKKNADGNSQPSITLEPAMVEYLGHDDDVTQVKAEHPSASFSEFMSFLIRLAGVKLGLPLELALLDFSRTNYSSARASMEQAYRVFRIEQRLFAGSVLSRLYRWKIERWVQEGTLTNAPSDATAHQWYGQEWPYLDPLKDAAGSLLAVDAGQSTLTKELAKRGMDFREWLDTRSEEIAAMAGRVPLVHSTGTRHPQLGVGVEGDPLGFERKETDAAMQTEPIPGDPEPPAED